MYQKNSFLYETYLHSFLFMRCTCPKIIPVYVLHVPQNHSFLCVPRTTKSFLSLCCTYHKIIPFSVLHVTQNHSFLCAARTPKSFLSLCCTYPKIISNRYAFSQLSALPEKFFWIFALSFQSFLPPWFTHCTEFPQSFFHS